MKVNVRLAWGTGASESQDIPISSLSNPTEEAHTFSPRVTGVKLRGQGKLWQIAAPSVDTTNEPGKKPAVDIVESPQQALAEEMRVPPISVNVYEFTVE